MSTYTNTYRYTYIYESDIYIYIYIYIIVIYSRTQKRGDIKERTRGGSKQETKGLALHMGLTHSGIGIAYMSRGPGVWRCINVWQHWGVANVCLKHVYNAKYMSRALSHVT